MNNEKKYQITLWVFIAFASLALGVGAYEYVLQSGGDKFIAIVALVAITAIGLAAYAMIRTALEELFEWIQNRYFADRFQKVTKEEEIVTAITGPTSTTTEKSERVCAIEDEIATMLQIMDERGAKPEPTTDEIKTEPTTATEKPRQTITQDMIFQRGSFEKLQILEKQLIADKYLTEDLQWIAEYNGRKNLKSLIIFIMGLMEEEYFLPYRDPKIKIFFEERYRVSFGQGFEQKRREKYMGQYRMTF
ncbi:MAG: hypothetical protein SNI54_06205, partial [Rikenellaceae bacterium]